MALLDTPVGRGKNRHVRGEFKERRASVGDLVFHFLSGRPAVWIVAIVISLATAVAMNHLSAETSVVLAAALIVLACAGITAKDRVRVVGRRRVRFQGYRLSRRRMLAMGLAIGGVTLVMTSLARALGASVLARSEEELRRLARPNKKKGER